MLPSVRNLVESYLPGSKEKPIPRQAPACAVVLRTDMIGDHIIFGGFIERLREAWPKTRLVLVIPEARRNLYEHCPCFDQLITYDYRLPGNPRTQREKIYRQIRDLRPDWIINPMYIRSRISDRIVRYCYAPVRIGWANRSQFVLDRSFQRFDRYYTHLLSPAEIKPWTSEKTLQQIMLTKMGIFPNDCEPQVWTSPEDEIFADHIYSQHHLSPEKTIVYFSRASTLERSYPKLKNILASLLNNSSYSLIALGASSEYETNHAPREDLSPRWLNLCGRTTMAQSAEIMRRCRLVVGVDTGPMHVARAVKAPHVVLLGGMHFGRFFPNATSLCSVVIHPLNCYFCDECRYEQCYCISDISGTVIRSAIDDALHVPGKAPRVYLSRAIEKSSILAGPVYAWEPEWVRAIGAEVIQAR